MEVTIENFEQVLPVIEDSIRRADFVAIDTEFSGKKAASSYEEFKEQFLPFFTFTYEKTTNKVIDRNSLSPEVSATLPFFQNRTILNTTFAK